MENEENKEQEKKEKGILIKSWTIETYQRADGSTYMIRTNNGYSSFELIGMADYLKKDIYRQAFNWKEPEEVERIIKKQP